MRKRNWRIDIEDGRRRRRKDRRREGKQRIERQEEEKGDYKNNRGEGMIATQNQAEKYRDRQW